MFWYHLTRNKAIILLWCITNLSKAIPYAIACSIYFINFFTNFYNLFYVKYIMDGLG